MTKNYHIYGTSKKGLTIASTNVAKAEKYLNSIKDKNFTAVYNGQQFIANIAKKHPEIKTGVYNIAELIEE
jgi:aromatic ring hydroxylase